MKKWYQKSKEEVIKELETSDEGLSEKEIRARIEKYGKNILPKKKQESFLEILVKQLADPIVILLIVTVIFSFAINEVVDAFAIIFIIVIDLLMGTFQEYKASKNKEVLANLIKVKVKVMRNNIKQEIDSADLVPGDIIVLEPGDKISADIRIVEAHNLSVDESILTGESVASVKNNKVIDGDVSITDTDNMVFAGTAVITGRAIGIVVGTGIDTEIGKIAVNVTEAKEEKSPLTIRMNKFSKQITLLIIAVAIVIATVLILKNTPGKEVFLSVIALSVSAMPEGLPLALTMALTIASNAMSKKNVVVKKLKSVESLGSCTVIATDKTGTLTVNEQTAKRIVLPTGVEYVIDGTGYNDKGAIKGETLEKAIEISKYGVLNNEALLEKEGDKFRFYGDSIDIAFLALGKKAGVDISNIKIYGGIPYESENKYSAVFYKEENTDYCTVKGSLEKVLSFCKNMDGKTKKLDKQLLLKQNEELASNGYRVIAIATGKVDKFKEKDDYEESDVKDLTFMGLVAFIDPIREEVKEAIEKCHTAGIKVLMITGDHPLTAFAISKELSLANDYIEVATGEDVTQYFDKGQKEFDQFVANKKVFTRVTPLQKLEIVESLKRSGEFVAVTGDGVNDAPAIKSANIGIAMGSGTDVAKETASMIILDDNFKSIVAGIEEGRRAYSNIRKVSYMLLSCGLSEVLFFLLAILFNLPMPLVAIQLLWLNIVTDGLQDLALSFEKAEKNAMQEKPRSPKENIFNKSLLQEVAISGLTIGIVIFALWYYLVEMKHFDIALARGYIMTLMVFMQNMHVLNCRSEKTSAFKVPLKENPFVLFSILSAIVLQVIISEVPLFSRYLKAASVPFIDLIWLFILSTIVLWVMEIYKRFKREKG